MTESKFKISMNHLYVEYISQYLTEIKLVFAGWIALAVGTVYPEAAETIRQTKEITEPLIPTDFDIWLERCSKFASIFFPALSAGYVFFKKRKDRKEKK